MLNLESEVVVVFTDIVDSVAVKRKFGLEAYLRIVEIYHGIYARLLKNYNGKHYLLSGDGTVSTFPSAAAAVGMALSFQMELAGKDMFAVRIGIHKGEVTWKETQGLGDGQIYGVTIDIAGRLGHLAQGKQILVSEIVATEVVGDEVMRGALCSAYGPYDLKGLDSYPQNVFEIGIPGLSLLQVPQDSEKSTRGMGDPEDTGERLSVGQPVPGLPGSTLEKQLNHGGFGHVWLATINGKEKVVVKSCHKHDQLPYLQRENQIAVIIQRYLPEFKASVPVIFYQLKEKPHYLVGDFVVGGDLGSWAEKKGGLKSLSMETRLHVITEVARALNTLHNTIKIKMPQANEETAVKVVHGDVKPTNILVEDADAALPAIRLIDFGSSAIINRHALEPDKIDTSGFFTGMLDPRRALTQVYSPPEAISGAPVGATNDIYAIGILLYQMILEDFNRTLTSEGKNDIKDPILAGIIDRCVAESPGDRYASMEDVLTNLENLETNRRQEKARQEMLQRSRRNRKILVAGSTLLAIVALIAVVLYVGYRDAIAQRQRAVEAETLAIANQRKAEENEARANKEAERAREEAERAKRIFGAGHDYSEDLLTKLNDMVENLPGSMESRKLLAQRTLAYLETLESQATGDRSLEPVIADTYDRAGDIQLSMNSVDAAIAAYSTALVIREGMDENVTGKDGRLEKIARSHENLGDCSLVQYDLAKALGSYGMALKLHSEALLLAGGGKARQGALFRLLQKFERANILHDSSVNMKANYVMALLGQYKNALIIHGENPRTIELMRKTAETRESVFRGRSMDLNRVFDTLAEAVKTRAELMVLEPRNDKAKEDLSDSFMMCYAVLGRDRDLQLAMARYGYARSVTLRLDLSPAGTIVSEQDLARDAERYGDFLMQTKALAPGADTHYAKAMQTWGGRREKAPHEVEAITAMARLHRKQGLYQVKVRKSAETAKIEFASARKLHDTLLKLDPTDWVQKAELSETLMHLCRAALTLHDFPLVMETSQYGRSLNEDAYKANPDNNNARAAVAGFKEILGDLAFLQNDLAQALELYTSATVLRESLEHFKLETPMQMYNSGDFFGVSYNRYALEILREKIGDIHLELGQFENAEKNYDTCLNQLRIRNFRQNQSLEYRDGERSVDDAERHQLRAERFIAAGEQSAAMAEINKALLIMTYRSAVTRDAADDSRLADLHEKRSEFHTRVEEKKEKQNNERDLRFTLERRKYFSSGTPEQWVHLAEAGEKYAAFLHRSAEELVYYSDRLETWKRAAEVYTTWSYNIRKRLADEHHDQAVYADGLANSLHQYSRLFADAGLDGPLGPPERAAIEGEPPGLTEAKRNVGEAEAALTASPGDTEMMKNLERAYAHLYYEHDENNEPEKAFIYNRKSIELAEEIHTATQEGDDDIYRAYHDLGLRLYKSGDKDAALSAMNRVVRDVSYDTIGRWANTFHLELAHGLIGDILLERGDRAGALASYTEAVLYATPPELGENKERERRLDKLGINPLYLPALLDFTTIPYEPSKQNHRLRVAELLFDEMSADADEIALMAMANLRYANLLAMDRFSAEAELPFQKCVDLLEKLHDRGGANETRLPLLADVYFGLARSRFVVGKFAGAGEAAERERDARQLIVTELQPGEDEPKSKLAETYERLGDISIKLADPLKAVEYYRLAISLLEELTSRGGSDAYSRRKALLHGEVADALFFFPEHREAALEERRLRDEIALERELDFFKPSSFRWK